MLDETAVITDIVYLQEQINTLTQRIEELEQSIADKYASKAYVSEYLERMVGDIITVSDKLTGASLIKGYEPLDIDRVLPKFTISRATYNTVDWRNILRAYDVAAKAANINPYILIAQMAKETDWGRSWWSQRPRRNPAGIGVTGETSKQEQDKNTWAYDNDQNIWKKGYSFVSWEIAAQAHTGHMLAYMYKDSELNSKQALLVATDPRARFIPTDKRGSVLILNDLDGKWAVPGRGYGNSIATLANALRK
jgi:hypothetical protein